MAFFGSEILVNNKIYILLNKPIGYVCSSVSDSHLTVFSLLPKKYLPLLQAKRGMRLHTVGRLDSNTSGLLLITNDGQFSHYLTAPKNKINKTYLVKLEKSLTYTQQTEYIKKAKQGLILPAEKKSPEQRAGPCKIEFLQTKENFLCDTCKVVLSEGKFHQVRRMFLALGNKVISLQRVQIGCLSLPSTLKQGEYMLLK